MSNVVDVRKTGVLPFQLLEQMVRSRAIASTTEIELDQIQPASLDLRLGRRAYRVRASFLAGPNATVMEKVEKLDGLPAIDITAGAVLERGAIYVVELMEFLSLPHDIYGVANPKSSTGRLDILTRLITDRGVSFDRVDYGYKGPLFIEIAPLSFSIVVKPGIRLNQLRLQRGEGPLLLPQKETSRLYEAGQLTKVLDDRLPLREDNLVPVTIDLEGAHRGATIGYKARRNANKIHLDRIGEYDPRDFWQKLVSTDGSLNLEEGDFYILATREDVGVPPQVAAEMVPYDNRSGEFRVHYAGFFDPGFGWTQGQGAEGSKAVLEVRSHGVSFTLEHGQIIGWLRYAPIANGHTTKIYGRDVKSNYQGQGLKLAKQFKPWPTDASQPDLETRPPPFDFSPFA
ncbi:2'-deoxycytidine 5'-triphosphate deaminase [Methylobacterium sp. 391_Methyba4]|uniref:2'-deoxycytidine 5'-triphosphate deaminase n=1 Tax=Methylobacterium sp. 391_Methyba4 TaxID=3038924 RepID=UPI00241C51C9|nr:2'-deoxycytidine 5'-triphosphate deaminase [Methylobacterium sp. 391_Methyba4]WFS06240.1 2'-deoxycytidine 5'-triphosphate deaminase [Methylobacterium sp. 391_Methyba4]